MPGNWPVLFGKGPTEKDSSQGYLAGGLLHFGAERNGRPLRLGAVQNERI